MSRINFYRRPQVVQPWSSQLDGMQTDQAGIFHSHSSRYKESIVSDL